MKLPARMALTAEDRRRTITDMPINIEEVEVLGGVFDVHAEFALIDGPDGPEAKLATLTVGQPARLGLFSPAIRYEVDATGSLTATPGKLDSRFDFQFAGTAHPCGPLECLIWQEVDRRGPDGEAIDTYLAQFAPEAA